MREVAAEFANPVMLYSIGKDFSVMLHLAMKAFYPSKPPFPLMHVDTTWKFREMIEFRDETAKRLGLDLIVHINQDGVKRGINPFDSGSSLHTQVMKTEALKQALDKYGSTPPSAARAATRKKAAPRSASSPSARQACLGSAQPAARALARLQHPHQQGESIRVFPLSNWTELDIWQYILAENIPIVPLYFAKKRPVVERDGTWIMRDDDRMKLEARREGRKCAGSLPHPGLLSADRRDRIRRRHAGRHRHRDVHRAHLRAPGPADRQRREGSMEKKKKEGYF